MRTFLACLLAGIVVLGGAFAIACGDDDPGEPSNVTAEPDPEADPDPVADPDPEPSGDSGTVTPPPPGSVQINVTLGEWSITTDPDSVRAGLVYFRVDNLGPEDAHEFVVIRSDEAPDALPTDEGKVPEDEVDLIGEIEPFAPDTRKAIAFDLEAGAYVLICNIAEVEEGELESHYELGMRTAFTVD